MTETRKQFKILGIILQARKPLTIQEIIAVSGMAPREVRRLIRYLRNEGFVG